MTDTRDDFEHYFKLTIRQQKLHMDGYRDPITQARWEGWQAREQLAAPIPTNGRLPHHADWPKDAQGKPYPYDKPAQGERQPEAQRTPFCGANCTGDDHHPYCTLGKKPVPAWKY